MTKVVLVSLALATIFILVMLNMRDVPTVTRQPMNAISDLQAAGLVDGDFATVKGGMIDKLPDVYSANIEDRR